MTDETVRRLGIALPDVEEGNATIDLLHGAHRLGLARRPRKNAPRR